MITVTSFWSEEYQPLADVTWPSKNAYAKRHGYKRATRLHRACSVPERIILWLDVLNEMPEGEYMFFTGCDSVIHNPALSLGSFFTGKPDFILGLDRHEVFGDCFIMRNSQACRSMLLEMLSRQLRGEVSNEQRGFTEYLSRMSWEKFRCCLGDDFGTLEYRDRGVELLSKTDVTIEIPFPLSRICGDDPKWHAPGLVGWWGAIQPATLVAHMGARSLEQRIKDLPAYIGV